MTPIWKKLKSIYFNPEHPASFSSAERLYQAVKGEATKKDVNDFLQSQFAYSLHKPVRHNFIRNKTMAAHPLEHWQADLADMQAFANVNRGFNYILMVIDVFTKYLIAVPLKKKDASSVTAAFESTFKHGTPLNICTDEGRELNNSQVMKLCEARGINFFFAKNKDTKAAIAERVIRTIKSRMFKYFSSVGNRKWVDILPKLVKAYNESYHRSIKMRPIDVTESNSSKVFQNLYGFSSQRDMILHHPKKLPKLKKGDHVRIKHEFNVFDKGYYPNWQDKVLRVADVIETMQGTQLYKLKYNEKLLDRRFYDIELQKVPEPERYRIEKVIKHDKKKKRVLVRWLGYTAEDDSWIPDSEYKAITED